MAIPLLPLAGLAIFLAVVASTIARPRGLPEWAAAVCGALAAIAIGLLAPIDAVRAVAADWNVLLFFVGMTGLAAVAERSGFFERAATFALSVSRGDGRLLLLATLGIGTVISSILSNDATALILTPVVYRLVVALGIEALPYVLACTFIADAASLVLPVSNPVNLLVLDGTGMHTARYLAIVTPAAIVAIALTIGAFMVFFRRDVPRRLPATPAALDRGEPPAAPLVWLGLAVIALAFVTGGLAGAPLGPVAVAGFALLLILEAVAARRPYPRPWEGVSWRILLYVAGMVVLVAGLERQGIVQAIVGAAFSAARGSTQAMAIVASLVAATGSNLVNNVPMTLVSIDAINAEHLTGALRDAAAVGTIVGADLGPNLTPVGSLATVLWLLILRERGFDVRPVDYLRFGLLTTPLILIATTLLVASR